MNDIFRYTAMQLVRLLQEGNISAEELCGEYLRRIRAHGRLRAVGQLNAEVLRQARYIDALPRGERGALCGLPLLVKDNIDVAGLHTTAGSEALADNLAAHDAPVVANLRRHGALILGKSNMTEFANYTSEGMPNGFSSHGGQVLHAYGDDLDASGSSTGSAVAVSAGLCAAAVGTDTFFSIVGCASEHSITGYKPLHGALSAQGIVPIARTLDSAGPMTRDVADALLLYNAMRDEPLPGITPLAPSSLRLAVNMHGRDEVSDGQMAAYRHVIEALERDGGSVLELTHPQPDNGSLIMACEFRQHFGDYLAQASTPLKSLEDIIAFYEANPAHMPYGISQLHGALHHSTHDAAYQALLVVRSKLRAELTDSLRDIDAVLMTGPIDVMHIVGFPSIALPLGMNDAGHPRGMILYGADERRLLAAALTLEGYCQPVAPPFSF